MGSFDRLLEVKQDVLVALELFFYLGLGALGLFQLQVESLDVSLYFFDTFDDFFFENALSLLDFVQRTADELGG